MTSGLSIRQGTVYRETASGKRLLLIHHNPMALRSLAVPGTEDSFDCAAAAVISVDDLIAMRKSGCWEELGDVPDEVFQSILNAVIASAPLADEDETILKTMAENKGKTS